MSWWDQGNTNVLECDRYSEEQIESRVGAEVVSMNENS